MKLLAEPTENTSSIDDVLCDTLSSYFKFKGVFYSTFFQIKSIIECSEVDFWVAI